MKVTDYLRDRLLSESNFGNPLKDSLEELRASEWSPEFERHMRDRLIVGAFRYGKLSAPNKPRYNHVEDIKVRLAAYQEDGNTEHLVDIANIALLEFVEGIHPKKHFRVADDEIHAEKL